MLKYFYDLTRCSQALHRASPVPVRRILGSPTTHYHSSLSVKVSCILIVLWLKVIFNKVLLTGSKHQIWHKVSWVQWTNLGGGCLMLGAWNVISRTCFSMKARLPSLALWWPRTLLGALKFENRIFLPILRARKELTLTATSRMEVEKILFPNYMWYVAVTVVSNIVLFYIEVFQRYNLQSNIERLS